MIALLPSFKTNLFLLTGDLPPFTWNTSATVISSTLIPMTITFVSVTFRHYISFCDITFVSVTLQKFMLHYIRFCDRSVYSPQVPGDPLHFAAPISTNHIELYK